MKLHSILIWSKSFMLEYAYPGSINFQKWCTSILELYCEILGNIKELHVYYNNRPIRCMWICQIFVNCLIINFLLFLLWIFELQTPFGTSELQLLQSSVLQIIFVIWSKWRKNLKNVYLFLAKIFFSIRNWIGMGIIQNIYL